MKKAVSKYDIDISSIAVKINTTAEKTDGQPVIQRIILFPNDMKQKSFESYQPL